MKIKLNLILLLFLFLGSSSFTLETGDPTALEIVTKADQKLKGKTSTGTMKMTIVRPTWQREMVMKSWSKGDELSLILITAPAREKGTSFLKRGNEIWNWQPSIDRTIKLPPSMMSQSWMGSDFSNDDLVKQSSMITDYVHTLLGSDKVEGRDCWKVQLVPKEDAAVVWGKIVMWIDKSEFMQMKTTFYDEDEYLINTMIAKKVKDLGGKLLPSILEIIPEEEANQKTIIEYVDLSFDMPMKDSFFSTQNMKRVR